MIDIEGRRGEMREVMDQDWYRDGLRKGLQTEARFAKDEDDEMVTFQIEHDKIIEAYRKIYGWYLTAREQGEDLPEHEELKTRFKQEARLKQKQMNELNRQIRDSVLPIEVETEELGRHMIPMTKFDLYPEIEGRVPYVIIGGIASRAEQVVNLAAALAMDGEQVWVWTYPEQNTAECPADWLQKIKKEKSFRLHAELAKEVIEKLELGRFNLVGFSMGGGISLMMGQDEKFTRQVQKLIALDPVGLEKRNKIRMGINYYVQQGLSTGGKALTRARLLWNQRKRGQVKEGMFDADADILIEDQFNVEALAKIQPNESFQVWIGSASPLTNQKVIVDKLLDAELIRSFSQQHNSALQIFRVGKADHAFPLINSLGLVRMMKDSGSSEKVVDVSAEDLEDYIAWSIYLRITNGKNEKVGDAKLEG